MTKRHISILLLFFCAYEVSGQKSNEEFYSTLLGKDSIVDLVLKNRNKYRLQFIVTDIKRDKNGIEDFTTFDFTTHEYFYPASLVKVPTAIAMLEILDSLHISYDSYIKMNQDFTCGNNDFVSLSMKHNIPISLGIEDMLSISDNRYYSLFFNVVTPKVLNYKLQQWQLLSTNIYSGFTGCPKGKELKTHSYSIFSPDGNRQLSSPKSILDSSQYLYRMPYTSDKLIGKYRIESGKKIAKPFDFNATIDYPLKDIHKTVLKLVFPDEVSENERFKISSHSRKFLLKCMGNYPREMTNDSYHNINRYPDNYFKYSIIGNQSELASTGRYRIYSKIGIAYGFVTESAYIIDFENQKDFIVSVSIFVNEDEIMNDNVYEYSKIARPFIANFTRVIQSALMNQVDNRPISKDDYFILWHQKMGEN